MIYNRRILLYFFVWLLKYSSALTQSWKKHSKHGQRHKDFLWTMCWICLCRRISIIRRLSRHISMRMLLMRWSVDHSILLKPRRRWHLSAKPWRKNDYHNSYISEISLWFFSSNVGWDFLAFTEALSLTRDQSLSDRRTWGIYDTQVISRW